MASTNERRRYMITPSLIGRAHTQNDPQYIAFAGESIDCLLWALHRYLSVEQLTALSCEMPGKLYQISYVDNFKHLFPTYPFSDLLTDWDRGKMATTLQTTSSNAFSWMKIFFFLLNFRELVLKSPIDNKSSLAQVLAWRCIGSKPLSEWLSSLTHMSTSENRTCARIKL